MEPPLVKRLLSSEDFCKFLEYLEQRSLVYKDMAFEERDECRRWEFVGRSRVLRELVNDIRRKGLDKGKGTKL